MVRKNSIVYSVDKGNNGGQQQGLASDCGAYRFYRVRWDDWACAVEDGKDEDGLGDGEGDGIERSALEYLVATTCTR